MALAPYLVACLSTLRAEFNAENPARDKGADGWIGDAAHQAETSDHNPDSQGRVLAIDIDVTGPWPADDGLAGYVSFIIGRCRSGAETRLEYVIFQRIIYSRSNNWRAGTYTGADPHTNHAHFSARHDHTGQSSTADWNLQEVSMPTPAEYAQAVASKLNADLENEASGLGAKRVADKKDIAAQAAVATNAGMPGALYKDIARGADTPTPPGRSGNNIALSEIVQDVVDASVAAALAPVTAALADIQAALHSGNR